MNKESVSVVAWKLLQTHLTIYEEPGATLLHKAVCEKIIDMRMYVPFWLLSSYKVSIDYFFCNNWLITVFLQLRNPSEILKLLHQSGRLDEAFDLAREYLLAALGYGKELFGFVMPLAPNALPFCLPVYPVQALIKELELQNQADFDKPFEKVVFTFIFG